MLKKDLVDNMKFRFKCSNYGLDWRNFEIYGEVIVINTPKNNVFVMFDKNFNTIGIHKVDKSTMNLNKKQLAYTYSEINNLKNILPYPFNNLTLEQLMNLSTRIDIRETNHGHSYDMIVNGDIVINDNNNYISLLSYIKFLGKQIEQYYFDAYHMKMIGFDYPNIYAYLKNIMININECIEINSKNNYRTFPTDIMEYLGQNNSMEDYKNILYPIIEFEQKIGLEKKELSILSKNLLKILDLSNEQLEEKIKENNKEFKIDYIDLKNYFEEDTLKETAHTLKKLNNIKK